MGKAAKQNIIKPKIITVRDVKEIAPEADIYQFSPHFRYIIQIDRSRLVGGQEAFVKKVEGIMKLCKAGFIPAVIMVYDEGVKFFEFEEKRVQISAGALEGTDLNEGEQ